MFLNLSLIFNFYIFNFLSLFFVHLFVKCVHLQGADKVLGQRKNLIIL